MLFLFLVGCNFNNSSVHEVHTTTMKISERNQIKNINGGVYYCGIVNDTFNISFTYNSVGYNVYYPLNSTQINMRGLKTQIIKITPEFITIKYST